MSKHTKSVDLISLYKIKIFLFVMLGYSVFIFIFFLLLIAISLLAYFVIVDRLRGVTIYYCVLLTAFSFILARSLWVPINPPNGIYLHSNQAKLLFKEVEKVRGNLRAPKIHEILLTHEFNASVIQTPRFGIFGWQKNHLILGLPLLFALSPDQFRGVIAHELGHLSGAHSRFSTWIYRIRLSFVQLSEHLEGENHWSSSIMKQFFKWYVPILNKNSLAFRRSAEFAADQCSARLIGEEQTGEMLIQICMKSTEATTPDDTHPSLLDRLSALGQVLHIPVPITQSAAQYYLGDTILSNIKSFNRHG